VTLVRGILFHIGDFPIRSYGVVIALAILLAMGVAYNLAKGTMYQKHLTDIVFYIVIGGIIGARFWEVFFFEFGYYSKHPVEILMIWNGGLSIQGSIIGGILGVILYTRRKKVSFWEFADILAPALVLGQAIGRVACFLNGDAFGSPTGSNFGLIYPKGTIAYETYGNQPLWPAEVMEAQWDLIVFSSLIVLKNKKWSTGIIFLMYNILYSTGRFALEFLRGDTPRYVFNWTAAQLTSVSVTLLSIVLIVYFVIKKNTSRSFVKES
jgi:phosphatidylglycerol:prolipoprotein diacylglycerol transferase